MKSHIQSNNRRLSEIVISSCTGVLRYDIMCYGKRPPIRLSKAGIRKIRLQDNNDTEHNNAVLAVGRTSDFLYS